MLSAERPTLGDESRLATRDAPVVAECVAWQRSTLRYNYRRIRTFRHREDHVMCPGSRLSSRSMQQCSLKDRRVARSDNPLGAYDGDVRVSVKVLC